MEPSGKINNIDFEKIIMPHCGFRRKEVSTGPAFGVDVSVIDLPQGMALALTSDPLSLIPSLGLQESAWLSVHLMANDMATTGFAPMYAQFVLNLPVNLQEGDFRIYWDFIHHYCQDIGIAVTGGHTGTVEGQNSTIAGGGTMLLTAPKQDILISKNAQPGDVIIVTKECALSSSAILAMSFPETVKNKSGREVYEQACALFYKTSSLPDGLAAAGTDIRHKEITAMHDVTEGGVLGAIFEMAKASGNGVNVYNEQIPVGEVQRQVCSLFDIDPRFCIGAGSMIIAADKNHYQDVLNRLNQNHIKASVVGEFTAKENGCKLITRGIKNDMPYYSRDPYWEAFYKAFKNGWK